MMGQGSVSRVICRSDFTEDVRHCIPAQDVRCSILAGGIRNCVLTFSTFGGWFCSVFASADLLEVMVLATVVTLDAERRALRSSDSCGRVSPMSLCPAVCACSLVLWWCIFGPGLFLSPVGTSNYSVRCLREQ